MTRPSEASIAALFMAKNHVDAWEDMVRLARSIGVSASMESKLWPTFGPGNFDDLQREVMRSQFDGTSPSGKCVKFLQVTVPVGLMFNIAIAHCITFLANEPLDRKTQMLLIALACAYAGKSALLRADEIGGNDVALRAPELECIRWAVAGKTLQDIAEITGIPYRTVRYHIDQARERYGYATNIQTYIRAAIDYGLDPLAPVEQAGGSDAQRSSA